MRRRRVSASESQARESQARESQARESQARESQTRESRALNQRMYLLEAEQKGVCWSFKVEGFSGRNYTVIIGRDKINCTCPDYKIRQNICKHLYFIVGRIACCSESMSMLENTDGLDESSFRLISDKLCERMFQRAS